MKNQDRRRFMKNIAGASLAISLPVKACAKQKVISPQKVVFPKEGFKKLTPLKDIKKLIPQPIYLDKIEIIKYRKEYMTRVTTKDGEVGYSMGNGRLKNTFTMVKSLVAPFFLAKDVRELANFHEDFYYDPKVRIYKYLSMPLWNGFGNIEVAVLDVLGKIADKNVRDLLGKTLRTEIPIYMSSLRRDTTPEEECEWLGERVEACNAKAIKIKIGGRMSRNADASPGRTSELIPYARKFFGDDFHIYVDSNGSYDVSKSIEVGKFLEEYNIGFYEEPNEWPDFVGLKEITDALDIVVAGGEQDHDWHKWKWMIDNKALDLIQPDLMYNGGILRTIRLANYAGEKGIPITTHNPRNNAEYANLLAIAAVLPNLGPYQEFRAELPKTKIPFSTKIECKNGSVAILTEPGMGIAYDKDFMKKGEVVLKVEKT